ncbi:hypothetical protein K1719_001889 [Acacia pycnantha]|nr:hypothetical protein K1719_001889 [Acacia pycnantha]
MATPETVAEPEAAEEYEYSVWALPTEDVRDRMKKLMSGLRSEFGACEGLKAYNATVDGMDRQWVYLLIHPTPQVVETSDHFFSHFGFDRSSPYVPHMSLLYGDLSEEERKKAQERANALDDVSGLKFQIYRLALYKTDTKDKTFESWKEIADCVLFPN